MAAKFGFLKLPTGSSLSQNPRIATADARRHTQIISR